MQINTLGQHIGQSVVLKGWAQTVRKQSKVIFIVLRDNSGLLQCVVEQNNQIAFDLAKELTEESVVEITGVVTADERSKLGYEIQVTEIEVLSGADAKKPIPVFSPDFADVDVSLKADFRWLEMRRPETRLVFKVWTALQKGLRDYCLQNDFLEIHSPKLMSAASEGGAEFFEVNYFERKAYLAQSPQFYKQMAMSAGFDRVFEIGPVFRAEPSFTTRHLTEFTGFDLEMSWVESHVDVMNFWEAAIAHALKEVGELHGEEIKEQYDREIVVPTLPFPRITMKEAKEILQKLGVQSEREGDLSPEEEREICEYVKKEFGHEFVFITEYPVSVRPFYHMHSESDSGVTKSFDLLWEGVEISTGAQREHRYDVLLAQAIEKGVAPDSIEKYLEFFKFGCPPHGGVGGGLERMIVKLLGLSSVREAAFLSRTVKRLTP